MSKSKKSTKAETKKTAKAGKTPKQAKTTTPDAAPAGEQPKTKATKKAAKAPKPKRVSALDAAAQVLQTEGKPMPSKALIEAMAAQGLWTSPGGKTPHATLYTVWTMLAKAG